MKKIVAMLLVLTMVLALAGTAMAACKLEKGYVRFTKDASSYSKPRESKKNVSVVKKGSIGRCDKICGKFAYVCVNDAYGNECFRWFKCSALENVKATGVMVVWAKGGKDMSLMVKGAKEYHREMKGKKIEVTGHTNLRKFYSLQCKSQGVVEKGDLLKMTGWIGVDNRPSLWIEVCYKGKKLWLSGNFADWAPWAMAILGGE